MPSIQIQGDNVVITSEQTVSKADYLAQQQACLVDLQANLVANQSQVDFVLQSISEVQAVIASLL